MKFIFLGASLYCFDITDKQPSNTLKNNRQIQINYKYASKKFDFFLLYYKKYTRK